MGLKRDLTVVPGSHILPGSGIPDFLSLRDVPAHRYKRGSCLHASRALRQFRFAHSHSDALLQGLVSRTWVSRCVLKHGPFAVRMLRGAGAIHLALMLIAIQVVKFAWSSVTHLELGLGRELEFQPRFGARIVA
ncbi:hypothetical protein FA13DRAFT_1330065 [Coprinellus micaceus]|uniref:Uncharacterized protein n=1 Tax=Coprinellus micaceus TaxID=71717 RepID=A0A4Y7SQS7_COPMI|nr:hypothetical protein FA13DRAFT_1330065 [Coprinellus micaceus]